VHEEEEEEEGFDSRTDLAKRSAVVWVGNQILVVGFHVWSL
jgi:hypothetical protein